MSYAVLDKTDCFFAITTTGGNCHNLSKVEAERTVSEWKGPRPNLFVAEVSADTLSRIIHSGKPARDVYSTCKHMQTIEQLKTGDMPIIGVSAMCSLFTGWTAPDPADCAPDVLEGYNVGDYFDAQGRYKGPDEFGVEPTFREMTDEEAAEYLAQDQWDTLIEADAKTGRLETLGNQAREEIARGETTPPP